MKVQPGLVRCSQTKVWVKSNPDRSHPGADQNFVKIGELLEISFEIECKRGCDGSECRAKGSKWVKMEESKPNSRKMRTQVSAICNQQKVQVKSTPANSLLIAGLNFVIREESLCETRYVRGCSGVGEGRKAREWTSLVVMALVEEGGLRAAGKLKKILDL